MREKPTMPLPVGAVGIRHEMTSEQHGDTRGYHSNYVHYNWHWFWKTGNGDLNNQGTHQLDVARWAIDTEQTHPVRVMAIGGRFQWKDQCETPNTMSFR